jgi:hypothetical protein
MDAAHTDHMTTHTSVLSPSRCDGLFMAIPISELGAFGLLSCRLNLQAIGECRSRLCAGERTVPKAVGALLGQGHLVRSFDLER